VIGWEPVFTTWYSRWQYSITCYNYWWEWRVWSYLAHIDDSRFHFYFLLDNRNKASFWNIFLTRNDSTDKRPIIYHFKNTSIEKYPFKFMNMQVSPNKEFFTHMSYCPITVTWVNDTWDLLRADLILLPSSSDWLSRINIFISIFALLWSCLFQCLALRHF